MLADSKALHVFENECPRSQFGYDSNELQYQFVSWVVQDTMPDKRKALAGCTAKHAIDLAVADCCSFANKPCAEPLYRMRNDRCVRKIKLMDRTMNRVDFDRCRYIETCLLETEA